MRKRRVTVVFLVLLAGFLAVEGRLVQLQVVEHATWAWEARRTATTFESLPFERGWILDHNGEPLARAEELRDLQFHYRRWRRGTTVGQAAAALRVLDGQPRAARACYERPDAHLDALLRLPLSDLEALSPRAIRGDLAWYLERLLGAAAARALRRGLAEGEWGGAVTVGDLPGAEEGRRLALARAAEERDALFDLAYMSAATPHTLLAQIDLAVADIDRRVDRIAAVDPGDEPPALRRRELHAEFDDDPALLASPVPYDAATLVALRGERLEGFSVRSERRRTYPAEVADLAPLLIGRVGKPGAEDMRTAEEHRLRLADLASIENLTAEELSEFESLRVLVREIDYTYTQERGVLGLEAALEPLLRGKRGYVARTPAAEGVDGVEVDRVAPQRGLNVTLTLDVGLQRACEAVVDRALGRLVVEGQEIAGVPAAIALVDPRSGAVRALATSPRPTRARLASSYAELVEDPRGPLHNRALAAGGTGNLPPPGSTFKPVVALAGLAAGVITPGEALTCEQEMSVGTQRLRCLGHHGEIALERALVKSCNHYFYGLADRVGGPALLQAARRFGFGRPTGLLRGNEVLESFGIPVARGVREDWRPLQVTELARVETMRLGIGQAPLDDVTPLQVAVMMGAIGVGALRPPSLVASVEGFGALPPREATDLGVPAGALAAVRRALGLVVEPGGTADGIDRQLLQRLGIDVAGKTGTPEVEGRPDHSWFAGWMPREDPVLAFAILLEHSGKHGGDAGVPIFNDLLAEPGLAFYLQREVTP